MKINRISSYVLIYLLTLGHWNLLVPVKAADGGRGSGGQSAGRQSGSSEDKTSAPKTGVDLNIQSDTQSTDNFDFKKVGEYVTYTAKENHAFKLVKDDKNEVWKASDKNYSSMVEVDHMSDGSKAVTVFPGDNTKVFLKGSGAQSFTEIDVSKVNAKTVNIGFEHESYFYNNELKGTVRTFTAKKGFAFKGANDYVDNDKVEVWKTDKEIEFASKIEVDGKKKITIHLADGSTKVIEKGTDNRWPGTVKGVLLNIKVKNSTPEFYYNKNGQIATFTARGNKGFRTIKSKKDGCCGCGGSDVTIWTTKDANEYATKVVLDGKGKKKKKLTIYLPNNTTKVFKRDGKGKPWNDVSPQAKDSAKTTGTTPAGGASQSGGSTK